MKAGLSGLCAACIFFAMTLVCAALRPDYNHATQLISELGETGGSYAWLFNYGAFLPTGVLITAFALYLRRWLLQRQLKPLAATLLALHGVGMVLAAWFSCDTGCNPPQPSSGQIAHNVLAAIKFPALIASPFVLRRQLRQVPGLQLLASFSFAAGCIALILMAAFVATAESRNGAGIYQRAFIGVLYLWICVIGVVVSKPAAQIRAAD